MNPFVKELSRKEISSEPKKHSERLVVEDNIGEGIHIHYRNLRLDFSVKEFIKFGKEISNSAEELKNGDC